MTFKKSKVKKLVNKLNTDKLTCLVGKNTLVFINLTKPNMLNHYIWLYLVRS